MKQSIYSSGKLWRETLPRPVALKVCCKRQPIVVQKKNNFGTIHKKHKTSLWLFLSHPFKFSVSVHNYSSKDMQFIHKYMHWGCMPRM